LDLESIVFFEYILVAVSFFTFALGLAKRSWVSMIISSVTSLPIVYYFLAYNNEWMKLVWFIPLLLLFLAFTFWWSKRKNNKG
jgi:presenilin-like A22 family membrane protease